MLAFAFCFFFSDLLQKNHALQSCVFKEMKTGGKIDYNHLQNTVKSGHFGTKFGFHPSNLTKEYELNNEIQPHNCIIGN